jgi:glycerol dehydrogenase
VKKGGEMTQILRSPAKYVQGRGELKRLHSYIKDYGDKVFIIISEGGLTRSANIIREAFEGSNVQYVFAVFEGKICEREIQELCGAAKSKQCNVIAGIGGGKIIDTAKAVAHYLNLPMAILPTVASTDAPCSALSIIYKEDDTFDKYLFLKESPNLVLVDTEIIVHARTELLTAGMGDALSTYYEARAVKRSGKNNQLGGKPTSAAFALAEKSKDIVLQDGLNAKLASEQRVLTPAFERVVEANTYLSGVGFESGGLGAAHAIQKGLTHCPALHKVYHGRKVAFCLIVQLVMENAPKNELDDVIHFLKSVDLPTTFAALGIEDITDDALMLIAERSTLPGMTIHNMPFEVDKEAVYAALKAANAIGMG